MHNKTALITGYTGQDGTFLTDLLLKKGYKVVGLTRRISSEPPVRVRGQFDFSKAIEEGRLILEQGDLLSRTSLDRIVAEHRPHEIYNLAWQSHVGLSFKIPEVSVNDFMGLVNLIAAVESMDQWYAPRIYQASTSEMFGDIPAEEEADFSLDELISLNPNSPYAIAKMAAHQYCKMKRGQGMFISCGILFNHESEIRGGDFVTQKIVRETVRWAYDLGEDGKPQPIELGNLDAKRDWGYAGDYVRAMHAMLQADKPDDFVIATGKSQSVREFVEAAFAYLDLSIDWAKTDDGKFTEGYVNGHKAVVVNPKYYRPNDVGYLNGDAYKAQTVLGWEPSIDFETMVGLMIKHEIDRKRQQK